MVYFYHNTLGLWIKGIVQIYANNKSFFNYIHFTDYVSEQIRLAVSIIDHISSKVNNCLIEEFSIATYFLENINSE